MGEMDDHLADELLRRALIDQDASAAVALRVAGLPLCEQLTVVFHGRRDLGTIQTYITNGGRGAGSAVAPGELLRVPCDLDPASARTPCSTSGASRSRISRTRAWRSTAASSSTSACPPTGCCRRRSSRPRS